MEQTAPSSDRTDHRAPNAPLVPPDERFWQRYSPHAEMPLSSAGSFAIHALLFGVLGLLAFLGTLFFNQGNRSLPVEAVRLDLGGGGGHPRGQGDGLNNGAPVEAGESPNGGAAEVPPEDDNPPPTKINVAPSPQVSSHFDSASQRYIQQIDTKAAKTFQRLGAQTSRIRALDGKPSGRGQGGSGSGGGSGDGTGAGVGNRSGGGHGTLTKREKRMIRWVMGFNPNDAQDYLDQLQGLGAILAVPVREDANGIDYKVIRKLSGRPPKLLDEDVKGLDRIFWVDDDARSAAMVMSVLRLPLRPSHFIAFMPKELEEKLFSLEKRYLETRYPGRTEDDIVSTKFQIRHEHGKYWPVMSQLKVKK